MHLPVCRVQLKVLFYIDRLQLYRVNFSVYLTHVGLSADIFLNGRQITFGRHKIMNLRELALEYSITNNDQTFCGSRIR